MRESSASSRVATICAPARAQTIGSRLLNEIERVVAKRERWRRHAPIFGRLSEFAPGLAFMTLAIDAGKAALLGGSGPERMRALRALEGFRDA